MLYGVKAERVIQRSAIRKTRFLAVTSSFTLYSDHQTTDFATRYLAYLKQLGYLDIQVVYINILSGSSFCCFAIKFLGFFANFIKYQLDFLENYA